MTALFRLLICSFVLWANVAAADSGAIRNTISQQIEAFKADDFDAAFEYASPNIQGIFKTPQNFGTMVRNGYPMVWRPSQVTFLDLRDVAGALWQRVQVIGPNGRVYTLDYQMVQTDGSWLINGVQLLPDTGAGV